MYIGLKNFAEKRVKVNSMKNEAFLRALSFFEKKANEVFRVIESIEIALLAIKENVKIFLKVTYVPCIVIVGMTLEEAFISKVREGSDNEKLLLVQNIPTDLFSHKSNKKEERYDIYIQKILKVH